MCDTNARDARRVLGTEKSGTDQIFCMLLTAASAPKTPLAARRKDVTRDHLDARERATYTI